MLHIVEVRRIGHDLENLTAELRKWLDDNGIQPAAFEHSAGGPGITFRVHFTTESEAAAFAAEFRGWLDVGTEPDGAARWAVDTPSPGSAAAPRQSEKN